MSTVALRSLVKRYGNVNAVDDITLDVAEGQLVALLGPSGCGKTTTLRMIGGFVEANAGSILIGGTDVTRLPPARRNIGFGFQNYALFPHLSVAQNVAFGLEMRRLPRPEIAQRVNQALDRVRLRAMADRLPKQLSGGQQQRVSLARALVIEPSVLLLDEPLSNLDAQLRGEMKLEIRQIQKAMGSYHDLRDPRSGRGALDRRPHRRDAIRAHRAGWDAGICLWRAAFALCRRVHGRDEPLARDP